MIDKIYLEITNICNLDCSFCHKTSRRKQLMTLDEFETLTDKLAGKAKFLYFHLMGEPTLHPLLPTFIKIARDKQFIPMLTTNGSLLSEKGGALLENLPYKTSISLHAPDANPKFADENYLSSCIYFAQQAVERGGIVVLRLWNLGTDADNTEILEKLHQAFPEEWSPVRGRNSTRIIPKLYLEYDEHFEWPDHSREEIDKDQETFCYGLRNHVGILVDGTVVPCCLDADGNLPLGNLFSDDLDNILASPRAKAIYDGFTKHRAAESFCRKCGFVKKFIK